MRLFKNFSIVAVAIMATTVLNAAAKAKVYGLAIGIDQYQHFPDLEGATADARDVTRSLRQTGAQSVSMLINGKATYRAIKQGWQSMLKKARRGDTLVFAYAGHGGQEREAISGSEDDGMDETFLLGGFSTKTPKGRRERIVDNEINAWFKQAGDKGVRVIFIADSCHSGTMTRDIDERVQLSTRSAPPYGMPDDEPISTDAKTGAMLSEDDLTHVTFFAATQEHSKVAEITINGRKRGALSWAFARALQQGADRNQDGVLTRFELESYIVPKVRQVSEARQTLDIRPRSVEHDQPLLELAKMPRGNPASSNLPLRVKIVHAGNSQKLFASLQGAVPVGNGEAPDLVYDANDRSVVNGAGDQVAEGINPAFLQGVVDKWRSLPGIKEMVVAHPLSISLSPDDARHPGGQAIGFETEPVRYSHLTVINLTPDGLVKYLYPIEGDPSTWQTGEPYRLDLRSMGPFGADHLLIIASKHPLGELQAKLRSASITGLSSILDTALKGIEHQIGLKGLYTYAGEGRE